ncbi:FtsX-like permease family protein [Catellatospora tritici]|uniref:FtsX-like permease family protein n=1 Tax=Catellatospora tritici TaxID=2851566 RepID=UPI001C2D2591|nr:FtsX-like permease family protein [Catellatospora tritici]MBV1850614.1 FtsX-like permease family protein [Catellatospora tritici]
MIALATLRHRWSSVLGTAITLAVAVGLLTAVGALLTSAHPVTPARYGHSPVLVRPVPPPDPESFTEPRPWSAEQARTLVDRLGGLEGVRAAVAEHAFTAQLLRDGHPTGPERQARGWSVAALGGYPLADGVAPRAADEVALDSRLGLSPGTVVTLLTSAGPERFTVSGTVSGPGLWVSDTAAAARSGGVPVIGLLLRDGADADTVATAARTVVGGDGVVLHAADRAVLEPVADARTRWIGLQVLTALTALTAFASVFIVAATFAFATRQRHRELGLLRLLGALPRQVRRTVHGEALLLGLGAGLVGVPAGSLAAAPVGRWLVSAGFQPPTFTVTVLPVVPAAAAGAGLLVAMAGAWSSARRAARTSPLAVLREAAVDDRPMTRTRWLAGAAALSAAGVAAVAASRAAGPDLGTYALYTAMALVAGAALLGPVLLPSAVRALTAPFSRAPGATVLLVRQQTRTAPRRAASIAAPVLLSVTFAVLIGGMVQTTTRYYNLNRVAAVGAVAVVVPDGTPGLSDAAVAAAGGRSALSTVLYDGPRPLAAIGVAPDQDSLFTVAAGTLADVHAATPPDEPGGAVSLPAAITSGFAASSGWTVGDARPVGAADGREHALRVVAVVDGPAPAGILLDRATARAVDPTALTPIVYLTRARPVGSLAGLGARLSDATTYAAEARDEDDRLVWVFTTLLIGVSAGYGLLAVVSTTLMATAARVGDLTVLRRCGATRRQLLGLLATETAVVVAVGAALGLGAAVVALAGLANGLGTQLGVDVPVVVPWGTLVATTGTALVLAVAAALLPAAGHRTDR